MTQLLLQVRQRGFISLRCLTSLTSLSLGSDCTNDTLAVVRQNQIQVFEKSLQLSLSGWAKLQSPATS